MNPGPKTSIDLNQLFTAVGDAILAGLCAYDWSTGLRPAAA